MKQTLTVLACLALTACGTASNNSPESENLENLDANNVDPAQPGPTLAGDQNVEQMLKSGASSMAAACGADSVKDYLISKMDQDVHPFSDSLFVKAHEPEIPYEITNQDIEAAKENLDPPAISAITVRRVSENIDKVECSASLSISSATGEARSYRIDYDLQPTIDEAGFLVSSDLDQPRVAWRVAIQGYAKGIAKERAIDSVKVEASSAGEPLN